MSPRALFKDTLEKIAGGFVVDAHFFQQFCKHSFHGVEEADFDAQVAELFAKFDLDADGKLESREEQRLVSKWLDNLMQPRRSALLVIDVQNDFIDGSLSIRKGPAGQDPESIIEPLNHLIRTTPFDFIAYSYDWHPPDHISFLENFEKRRLQDDVQWASAKPKMGDVVRLTTSEGRILEQCLWPAHCISETQGAQLHPRLHVTGGHKKIFKGIHSEVDSYSAFFDNEKTRSESILRDHLLRENIDDLYVCGLAYDVCVAWTAQDALQLGYRTAIIDDCTKGLDMQAIEKVQKDVLTNSKGLIVHSKDVPDFVSGKQIPWRWAKGLV